MRVGSVFKGHRCFVVAIAIVLLVICSSYNLLSVETYDYGKELEKELPLRRGKVRISPHNIGADYSLTFPSDITCNSKKSIRFEYRYEDTKADSVSKMRRARSEISGVFSKSLMSEWQVEFDLYVPEGTADDDEFIEIITQIHENSNTPISPSFCLSVKNGYLGCSVRGDSIPVNKWERHNRPTHRQSGKLLYLEKNRWYHVKSFVKEGYQYDMNPVTRVWVDSDLLFESYCPNCYNYKTTRKGCYNYLKFGIYKPSWRKMTEKPLVDKRIYYFDNYVVKV